MALVYKAAASLGNIEITLEYINNAQGTFLLTYNIGPDNQPAIPSEHEWVDQAIWVVGPVPPTVELAATVYNNSPGGNDGQLRLTLRQGTQNLTAGKNNDTPGNPCKLGSIPFDQAVPTIYFTVMVV